MTRHIKENEQGKEAEVVRLRTPPRKIWTDLMTGTIFDAEQIEHRARPNTFSTTSRPPLPSTATSAYPSCRSPRTSMRERATMRNRGSAGNCETRSTETAANMASAKSLLDTPDLLRAYLGG